MPRCPRFESDKTQKVASLSAATALPTHHARGCRPLKRGLTTNQIDWPIKPIDHPNQSTNQIKSTNQINRPTQNQSNNHINFPLSSNVLKRGRARADVLRRHEQLSSHRRIRRAFEVSSELWCELYTTDCQGHAGRQAGGRFHFDYFSVHFHFFFFCSWYYLSVSDWIVLLFCSFVSMCPIPMTLACIPTGVSSACPRFLMSVCSGCLPRGYKLFSPGNFVLKPHGWAVHASSVHPPPVRFGLVRVLFGSVRHVFDFVVGSLYLPISIDRSLPPS